MTCGGHVNGSSGWIASPDEDNDGWYDYNAKCHWTIEVDPSKDILFQILYVLTDPYSKQRNGTLAKNSDIRRTYKDGLDQDNYNNLCVDKLQVTC